MFEFTWLWVLLLLPLPWVVYRFVPAAQEENSSLKVPFYQQLQSFTVADQSTNWLRVLLAALIWLLLVLAAARPLWIGGKIALPTDGRNIMMAFDLSGSMVDNGMRYENTRLTRLDVVKKVGGDFIQRRKGDRIGIIFFADTAYLQTPFTDDLISANQLLQESFAYLRNIDDGLAGVQTSIGDAVLLATKVLKEQPKEHRVLVLLTDGENTSGIPPERASRFAKDENVELYAIGLGDGNGTNDFATLKKLVTDIGGHFYRAVDAKSLEAIYAQIDTLEPVTADPVVYQPRTEYFYIPLSIALLLSALLVLSRVVATWRPYRERT